MKGLVLCLAVAFAITGCNRDAAQAGNSMLDVGLMRVQDRAEVIPATEEIELARTSESLEKATTDQLVVVTVRALSGQDIAKFSQNLGNRMGLGRADK